MWNNQAATGNNSLLTTVAKDGKVMINNFEAASQLLNHGAIPLSIKNPTFRDKLDLFFVDHEFIPLLI